MTTIDCTSCEWYEELIENGLVMKCNEPKTKGNYAEVLPCPAYKLKEPEMSLTREQLKKYWKEIEAFKDGSDIQVQKRIECEWVDCSKPGWYMMNNYRVKPKEWFGVVDTRDNLVSRILYDKTGIINIVLCADQRIVKLIIQELEE